MFSKLVFYIILKKDLKGLVKFFQKTIFGAVFHKPESLLMNTKKHRPLNVSHVDKVTQMFRAYKHRYRYNIISRLLERGQQTASELADHLEQGEPYVIEQLAILERAGLVIAESTDRGLLFEANETVLLRLKKSVENLV